METILYSKGIRDQKKKYRPISSEICADSLVHLESADMKRNIRTFQVPADMRLIYANDAKLETSALTGEPEPFDYTTEAAAQHIDLFDARNVAFNGSLCLDGEALGVVIRTADNTIIGQIARMTSGQDERQTTLQIEINKFVRFITVLAVSMGLVVFVVGIILNGTKNLLSWFINGFVVVLVANVPQVHFFLPIYLSFAL